MKATLLILFIYPFYLAQSQALSDFADPTNTGFINQLTFDSAFDGVIVSGSFAGFTQYGGSFNNLTLVKSDGTVSAISGGINDTVVSSIRTSDGTLWSLTPSGLWKYVDTINAYRQTSFVSTGNVGLFEGESGNLIVITNSVTLNGAKYAIRFHPQNETTDTFGLTLPALVTLGYYFTYDPISIVTGDSATTYFNWNNGDFLGYIFAYDTASRKLSQVNTHVMYYIRTLCWSSSTKNLYYYGLDNQNNNYMYAFKAGQNTSVLLFANGDALSIVALRDTLYITGGFSTVNGQSIGKAVTFNEANSNFTAWNLGMNVALFQVSFFPNGKIIGSRYFTLVANINAATGLIPPKLTQFSIYPNPSTGEFFISYEGETNSEAQITVTNMLGQNVYRESYVASNGVLTHQINLVNCTPGLYLLALIVDGKIMNQKIVVN